MAEPIKDLAVSASVDIGTNLNELIMKLSETIGVTADKVFPWYVKQAVIEGYVFLVLVAVLGLISVIGVIASSYILSTTEKEDFGIAVLIPSAVLLFVVMLVGCIGLSYSIGQIVTPELFAMKAMMSDMQGFIK